MDVRTFNAQPRIYGRLCIYTIVDERLRYVRVYIPTGLTDAESVQRIITQVLNGRPAPLPKEGTDNG